MMMMIFNVMARHLVTLGARGGHDSPRYGLILVITRLAVEVYFLIISSEMGKN